MSRYENDNERGKEGRCFWTVINNVSFSTVRRMKELLMIHILHSQHEIVIEHGEEEIKSGQDSG